MQRIITRHNTRNILLALFSLTLSSCYLSDIPLFDSNEAVWILPERFLLVCEKEFESGACSHSALIFGGKLPKAYTAFETVGGMLLEQKVYEFLIIDSLYGNNFYHIQEKGSDSYKHYVASIKSRYFTFYDFGISEIVKKHKLLDMQKENFGWTTNSSQAAATLDRYAIEENALSVFRKFKIYDMNKLEHKKEIINWIDKEIFSVDLKKMPKF